MSEAHSVAVIGAGTMGAGIAQAFAVAGWTARLSDVRVDALPSARERIATTLAGAVARGKLDDEASRAALGRVVLAPSLAAACDGADVVVEAVIEDLAAKQEVLARAARAAKADALLATNTSALSISRIAERLPNPDRVLGLHFFNPVHIMKLAEIVVHASTADETRDRALEIVRALDKEPIVVQDSPGFASSRLGLVLGLEAMRMLEQGVASAADIDRAMELGYNHPMGPLRLTDVVGLDVRLTIAEYLHQTLGGEQFDPPAILRRLVADGKLGKKTGQGFYDWTSP